MRDGTETLECCRRGRLHSDFSMRAGTLVSVAIPLITVVLMTVVGSDLRGDDFRRLLRRSRLVWVGLLAPPLLLPPIALGLIEVMRPPLPIATGVLLIAACPVGGISNTYVYLARASTALSLALTTLSCLAAFVTVPLVGAALGAVVERPFAAHVPMGPLLVQLLATIALPVALGMYVRSRRPELTARVAPVMWRVAFVLLGLLLALVILADVPTFVAALPAAVPLAAVFVACSFAVGSAVGHLIGAHPTDRLTLAIEFATRNVAVATTIAVTVLGRTDFAIFGTAYFLTEVPLMAAAVVLFRRPVTGGEATPAIG